MSSGEPQLQTVTSKIDAVTVFPDRARTTRRAKLPLAAGTFRLEFPELPATLDPQSLRVTVQATGPVRMLNITAQRRFAELASSPRVRELEAQLEQLLAAKYEADDRQAVLARQLATLEGLAKSEGKYALGFARGTITPEQQAAWMQYLEREELRIREAQRKLRAEQFTRENERRRIDQELGQLRIASDRGSFTAVVEVALPAAAEVQLDLSYLLPGASWTPLYDLRLLGMELELSYLAEVEQATGEDWSNIQLTLSTARAIEQTKIPRLQPWRLLRDVPQPVMAPPPQGAWRARHEGTVAFGTAVDMPALAARAPAQEEFQQAEIETANVEQGGLTVSYTLPTRADIPSDRTPHKVTVGIFRCAPQFDFVCVPKLGDHVFRRVKTINTSPYTLLPGRMQLFERDEFLGTTDIALTSPKQGLDVCFGVDDRWSVQRRQTRRDVSKTMLTGRRKLSFAYQVDVRNHTGESQVLVVVDQFPLAQHEDIKVHLASSDPKPQRQDDFHTLIWKWTIPAHGEQTLLYEFTVEHPLDMPVRLGE